MEGYAFILSFQVIPLSTEVSYITSYYEMRIRRTKSCELIESVEIKFQLGSQN